MEISYQFLPYTKEDAYNLVDNFLDKLQKEHAGLISNASKEWNESKDKMDFSFSARRVYIKGDIKINEDNLVLNGDLPFPANLARGKIERIILENLDKLFV